MTKVAIKGYNIIGSPTNTSGHIFTDFSATSYIQANQNFDLPFDKDWEIRFCDVYQNNATNNAWYGGGLFSTTEGRGFTVWCSNSSQIKVAAGYNHNQWDILDFVDSPSPSPNTAVWISTKLTHTANGTSTLYYSTDKGETWTASRVINETSSSHKINIYGGLTFGAYIWSTTEGLPLDGAIDMTPAYYSENGVKIWEAVKESDVDWTSAVNFNGSLSQTDSGCVYNFSESNYVDIYFSSTASEVVWVVPFTVASYPMGRNSVMGHGEQDWFFPYMENGSRELKVYNGSVYTLFTPSMGVKYWLRMTRNYTARTVKYEYSTDGVTYTNLRTIDWNENPASWSGYIRLGNSVYTNELNRWWYGAIFLSEVKVTVDGVDLPLYDNIQDEEFVDDITITGQPVITPSGCVAGFKPDTHIELAMPEITGTNPSSTLTYIIPIVRTSQCPTNREAQMGWKAERWFLPKFINNSNNALYAYNNTTGQNVQVSPALTLYQKYWIKIDWTEGTGTRTYSYSTDGENFTRYTSFNDTNMASATPSGVTFLGMGNANSSETAQWFTGDIYLGDMKIIANGEEIPILKEIKPETDVTIFNFNKPLVIGSSKWKTAPFKFYGEKNMSLLSLKTD